MRSSILCCVLLLAASACGDDDDDGANSGGEPDAAAHAGPGGHGDAGGTGGAGAGSGGSAQHGTGGHTAMHGAEHDAGASHDACIPDDAGQDCDAGVAQPCSIDASDPGLPGVTLRVESDRCRVPFGEGQRFSWTLVLEDPIDYTTRDSGGSCGRCGDNDDSNAAALIDYMIERGHYLYCECDVGCCAPTTGHAAQLAAGSFSHDIDWPGRQWSGPSDTNRPLGDFFPAGQYSVEVTFAVPGVGSIRAELPIEVVDSDDAPQTCPDDMIYGKSCDQCGPTDACEVEHEGCLPKCTQQSDCAAHGGACVSGACRTLCG